MSAGLAQYALKRLSIPRQFRSELQIQCRVVLRRIPQQVPHVD